MRENINIREEYIKNERWIKLTSDQGTHIDQIEQAEAQSKQLDIFAGKLVTALEGGELSQKLQSLLEEDRVSTEHLRDNILPELGDAGELEIRYIELKDLKTVLEHGRAGAFLKLDVSKHNQLEQVVILDRLEQLSSDPKVVVRNKSGETPDTTISLNQLAELWTGDVITKKDVFVALYT
jgi:hypothetical protein